MCLIFVSVQPRDSCYVASPGLPELVYSGHRPHAHSWDEFPPLKDILEAVRTMILIFFFLHFMVAKSVRFFVFSFLNSSLLVLDMVIGHADIFGFLCYEGS